MLNRLLAVSLVAALLLCCARKPENDPAMQALAGNLAKAITENDEDLFARSFVSEGDMSPSGKFWLATKAGGGRPDAAWDAEVRAAFRQLADDLSRNGIDRR